MPMNQLEMDRHYELAAFLQSRRARLSPERVELPRGTRRRTPGLRRGEVAMLAGISLEWYTWLEQGRDINVSVQLLESLVRALQLDANERTHLFLLALRQPPPVETFSPTTISPILQNSLNQLGTTPAAIVDARLNVVAWNKAFCAIFGDYETKSERERNLIWRIFTSPPVNEQWEEHARSYLAQFRVGYDHFIEDPWWATPIAELKRISSEFRELWACHDVLNVPEGRKLMHHPLIGELAFAFEFLLFRTVDSSDLRLLIHTPRRNSGTADKIERLLAFE